MKKFLLNKGVFYSLLLLLLAVLSEVGCSAQSTVKQDANGNYVQVKQLKDTAHRANQAVSTGKTYTTAKGEVFPVYISPNNKLYVIRTSKNGNQYKQYLKL